MTRPKPSKRPTARAAPTKKVDDGKPHLPGKATTARKADGKFARGAPKPANAGRAKGKRNKTTVLLKEAILQAAELVGQDGRGKEGLTGYLKMLAIKERALFSRLLEKVLPMQLHMKDQTEPNRMLTPEEAVARLRERNVPVPPSLLLLSTTEKSALIAGALNDERADGATDWLDNRRQHDGLDDLEERD
jgi:hypothetical protein